MQSASDPDPTWWTATEIAAAVAERSVSIPEVVGHYLEWVAETAALNALAWCDPAEVRQAAAAAQARLDGGGTAGPLEGVPFTVKDVIATAGIRTSAGSLALRGNIPRKDATAVIRIRRAGGILLGKTNCPEFAFSITNDSPLHGRTISPWGADLSPGGSSGGESALLAAGASALGLGTDFGGSLRWPAQCTGVLALRPTAGRVPATGQIPGLGGGVGREDVIPNPATLQGRLQVIGPMARSVRDLQVALSVLSGEDGLDPSCHPPGAFPAAREDLHGLRFAWCMDDLETPCGPDVQQMMATVAGGLRDMGLQDVFRPDLLRGGRERYDRLRELDALAEIRLAVRGAEALLGSNISKLLERPAAVDAGELSLNWRRALDWRARFLDQLHDTPIAIAPVAPGGATGHDGALVVDGHRLESWDLMAYCRAVSLTGLPVVSIPCASSAEGLPLSVQVVGRPFHDDEALSVARALEALFGGARLPPRRDARSSCGPRSAEPIRLTSVDGRQKSKELRAMADRSNAEASLGSGTSQALSSPLPDGLMEALVGDPAEGPATRVAVRDFGPVAVVTLHKQDRLNALDYQAWCQLAAAFEGFGKRRDLRLVILRGAGERAFAAGADIGEFPRQRQTAEVAVRYNEAVAAALCAVMALPLPVVAMLNGLAVGGGCELAAACDVRISARHAKLGIPVGQLGVMLGPVESYAVTRVIGPARLKWLLFSGELLSAEQAERIGLVDRVVDQADLAGEIAGLARAILRSSPHTMQAAKQVTDMVDRGLTLRDIDVVTRLTVETYSGSELKRRVSAFLERSAEDTKEG